MADKARRADAIRSRRAIIEAYVALVRTRGDDVPHYEIGRAAGVGQGTLYRHFPTHASLAVAVFENVLSNLERLALSRAGDPDCFRALLEQAFQHQVWMHGLSDALVKGRDLTRDPELSQLTQRTLAVFVDPIQVARQAGIVRPDLIPDDIITMFSMLDGVLSGTGDPGDRRRAALRGIAFLIDGISSSSAEDGPTAASPLHIELKAAASARP